MPILKILPSRVGPAVIATITAASFAVVGRILHDFTRCGNLQATSCSLACCCNPELEAKTIPADEDRAKNFVAWWLTMALNYSHDGATAEKQSQYIAWCDPGVSAPFTETFWDLRVKEAILNGNTSIRFESAHIGDHSKVADAQGRVPIHVIGYLTSFKSRDSKIGVQHIHVKFLVRRNPVGYRIAGFEIVHAEPSGMSIGEFLKSGL